MLCLLNAYSDNTAAKRWCHDDVGIKKKRVRLLPLTTVSPLIMIFPTFPLECPSKTIEISQDGYLGLEWSQSSNCWLQPAKIPGFVLEESAFVVLKTELYETAYRCSSSPSFLRRWKESSFTRAFNRDGRAFTPVQEGPESRHAWSDSGWVRVGLELLKHQPPSFSRKNNSTSFHWTESPAPRLNYDWSLGE